MTSDARFDRLEASSVRMEASITKLADTMVELVRQNAVSNEKHEQKDKAFDRLGTRLESIEKKQSRMELQQTSNTHTATIASKLTWLIVGGVIAVLVTMAKNI